MRKRDNGVRAAERIVITLDEDEDEDGGRRRGGRAVGQKTDSQGRTPANQWPATRGSLRVRGLRRDWTEPKQDATGARRGAWVGRRVVLKLVEVDDYFFFTRLAALEIRLRRMGDVLLAGASGPLARANQRSASSRCARLETIFVVAAGTGSDVTLTEP